MSNKKKALLMMGIVAFCCIAMAVVDGILRPIYAIKSAVKLLLFAGLPLGWCLIEKGGSLKEIFAFRKKGLWLALGLCIPLYFLILGAYFLLKDVFDFSAITDALAGNVGVRGDNFIGVAIYIALVNSLLEEFLFRGFAFLAFRKVAGDRLAYLFSAAAFALYHIAIMSGWFSVWVFALALIGLFAGGLIFNFLDAKSHNIYTSWLVHMFANFAINTIGLLLFGII